MARMCSVSGDFGKNEFDKTIELLDDYSLGAEYGLISGELAGDVAKLQFSDETGDVSIIDFVYKVLSWHIPVYSVILK